MKPDKDSPSDSQSRRRKIGKRLRRVLSVLAVLFLLLAVALVGARLYFSDSRIRLLVEERLSEALGRKVTIDVFRVSRFSSVEITGLTVEDRPAYGGDLLTVERLGLVVEPLSIFRKPIRVSGIRIFGLRVRVIRTSDGRLNLSDLPESGRSGSGSFPDMRLDGIAAEDCAVYFEDRGNEKNVSLSDVRIAGDFSSKDNNPRLEVSCDVGSGAISSTSAPIYLFPSLHLKAIAGFDLANGRLKLDRSAIEAEGVKVELNGEGSITDGKVRLDAAGEGSVDLSSGSISTLLGAEGHAGVLDVRFSASGDLPRISGSVSIKARDLVWPVPSVEDPEEAFRIASIDTDQVYSIGEDGRITLQGKSAIKNVAVPGQGRLPLDDISLDDDIEFSMQEKSARIIQLDLETPGVEAKLSGSVSIAASGNIPLDVVANLSIDSARTLKPFIGDIWQCERTVQVNLGLHGSVQDLLVEANLSAPSFALTHSKSGQVFRVERLRAHEKVSLSEDRTRIPIEGSLELARFGLVSPTGEVENWENLASEHRLVFDSKKNDVDVASLKVSLPGISMTGSGTLKALFSGNPEIDWVASGEADLKQVLEWAAPEFPAPMEGVVRVDVSASGSTRAPRIEAAAKSDRLEVDFSSNTNHAIFENLSVSARTVGKATIAVSARAGSFRVWAGSVRAADIPNASFTADLIVDYRDKVIRNLKGRLSSGDLRVALTGDVYRFDSEDRIVDAALEMRGSLDQVQSLAFPETPWRLGGDFRAKVSVKGSPSDFRSQGGLEVDSLEFANQSNGAKAQIGNSSLEWRGHLTEPELSDLDVVFKTTPIMFAVPGTEPSLSLETPVDLRLTFFPSSLGMLDILCDLSIEPRLGRTEQRVDLGAWAISSHGSYSTREKNLTIDRASLRKFEPKVEIGKETGPGNAEEPVGITARGSVDLAAASVLANWLTGSASKEYDLHGDAEFSLVLRTDRGLLGIDLIGSPNGPAVSDLSGLTTWEWPHTFRNLSGSTQVRAATGSIRGVTLENATVDVSAGSGEVSAEIACASPAIDANLRLDYSGTTPRIAGKWRDCDLSSLAAKVGEGTIFRHSGSCDLTWLGGTRFDGTITSETAQLIFEGTRVIQRSPCLIHVEPQRVRLDRLVLSSPEIPNMQVAVNGIVPLAADRPELDLDLNVHEFNLATFKPDWEEIRGLAGTVQVNGKLTGSPSKPSFLGQLSLSKGRLRLTNFSQGLSDVEMSAIFDAEKIHVERLDGRLGRGVVSASGEIRRGDTRSPELDVDIGFKDVRYAETDYLSLEGSGNLLIHGPLDSATVEGQVEIARGSYTQPFDWTKIVLARFGTRSVEGAKGPAWNPNFDIEINVPGNFWVRNSIVKAEMGGQARLVGTVDSPSLTGRIYATRGAFQASYGTFQIQKAYALFDETRPFFPYLFLLGECRLSGYMVRLLVSGDPDSIEFQWSSSPPLTEEQIVQLLTTGSTERAVEGSQSASAAWILSQGLRYRVSESGAGLLPVDTIELSPSRKGDRTDTEIVAGKEITDRLAVKQYVDVKDPQNIALGADYKITKRFSVSGRAERNRNYIMEVVYEILF